MTRYEPTLIVRDVAVLRGGRTVYRGSFHAGVNIIQGANSSGKSTILNLICYGLGGDLADWSEHALLCDDVLVGVELSGKAATLRRSISRKNGQPMEIFGGTLEAAMHGRIDQWSRYPYQRSQTTESFSQALFSLLGIPEVTAEGASNVTMHQVLRLLYADQLSPADALFRQESFDAPTLRDAVGRLLCGVFEPELYDNEIKLKSIDKQFSDVSSKLGSIFAVLGTAKHDMSLLWVREQREKLSTERADLESAIAAAEQALFTSEADDALTLDAQNAAYATVQRISSEIAENDRRLSGLKLSIADSDDFLADLERKLSALNDAQAVADDVGAVQFHWCPSCYAPLEDAGGHACYLCKLPFDPERSRERVVGMINETRQQLRQSKALQAARVAEVPKLERQLTGLREQWTIASARFNELRRLPSTLRQAELRDLQRRIGYLDRQQEDLDEKAGLVDVVDRLSAEKASLSEQADRLRTRNDQLRHSVEQRQARAYSMIESNIRDLLTKDLRRQDSFVNPERVRIDFGGNRIYVDGHTYFSASSRVILKTSFVIGFLEAALQAPFFRHPRFCMLDTIEDKGMEVERSQNLQRQIARISSSTEVEHQIIYATSMIAPELDTVHFVIGDFTTLDRPTLDLMQ
ncbi:AAA family ATPase [Sphingomonadaceae bacterium OTU29THOMA1]|nr:AAA family ATPase [Sphingomonadaceae bacterium OTU29THOMA1]